MKKFVYAAFLIFTASGIFAKTDITLSGYVTDDKDQPFDWATVSLLHWPDSTFISGTQTDSTGYFAFAELTAGKYILKVNALGYHPNYIEAEVISGAQNDAGKIVLQADDMLLNEVQILAVKPVISNNGDKLVMNIENTVLGTGGNAIDVLKRTPGVMVDNDDNIVLKGKSGVNIMVNDKQIYLAGDQLENYLKNLPSDQIAQIEVITNPSARYDAEGNAGIINIVLKKNKLEGFNGSLLGSASKGYLWNYRGGANINYMHNRLSVMAGYNYNMPQYTEGVLINRNINYEGMLTKIDETSDIVTISPSHSANIGIDYAINDKNTIGFSANGFTNKEDKSHALTEAFLTDGEGNFLSHSQTTAIPESYFRNYALDAYYTLKIDTTGKKLSFDVDRAYYDGGNVSTFSTIYFDAAGTAGPVASVTRNDNPTTIYISSAKIDYTNPLKKNASFDAGIKSSYVVTDNEIISDYLDGSEWIIDTNQTNHFEYSENINAAYINFSKQFTKIQLNAGLRAEQTISKGNSITLNNIVDRSYIDFFPSFSVNDVINEKNMLGFTYSRRINRPSYRDLNPFIYYLDPYVFVKGNPYLQPETTHSLELSYTYKQTFMASLSYSNSKDYIMTLLYQEDSTNTTYQTTDNMDHFNITALTIYTPFDIAKWWNLTPMFTVYQAYQNTDYEGVNYTVNNISFNGNLSSNFILPKNFTVELSGHYEHAGYWGIIKYDSQWNADLGIKKTFMQGKFIAGLSATDIFNTADFSGTFDVKNIDAYVYNDSDSRTVRLSLSYNFGKNDNNRQRHQNGSEDEMNRVRMH